MKRLIVTADDFGAARVVNEAVEQAHNRGILTAASLMVSGEAADDAVARARRLPTLGVGLHLVLVDGRPMLPAEQVPDLVDDEGRFRTNMAAAGVRFFFSPCVRRQLAAEIEAQFAAFAATGLALDHVNAHKHFHLHPTITRLILRIGARYGLAAARAPIEPRQVIDAIEPAHRGLADRVAAPWARATRTRLVRAGLIVPDQVFGLAWSGAMTTPRLQAIIAALPAGLSEIYLHPATANTFSGHANGYLYRDELAALIAGAVRSEVTRQGIQLGRFMDFAAKGAAA